MSNGARQDARSRLIRPEVLSGLANLELIARSVVEGVLIGLHRSPFFGFSQEFAEYRPYVEGDDPRFVDWNVYARTDRTYIKRFLGDTNSHLMLLLDASASMGYGSGKLSKFRYAQMLAGCLAWLSSRQHDAVGTLIFDDAPVLAAAPAGSRVPAHAVRVYGALVRAAQMAGALEGMLQQSVRYVTERRQFGRPIGAFQAIQHALAVLAGHSAAAGIAAEHAFRAADRGEPVDGGQPDGGGGVGVPGAAGGGLVHLEAEAPGDLLGLGDQRGDGGEVTGDARGVFLDDELREHFFQ